MSRTTPSAPVVEVEGLSKRFDIYPNDRARLLEVFLGGERHTEHWALQDISFKVAGGQAFGVIGSNGAGKSTLLKILSGISPPTTGSIQIRASLNSLLDLGVGFHGDFTGRQNTLLACRLLGMTEAEIADRVPEILEFAEIDDFLDHPVRTYSTGMSLRLGFSIAAHLGHKILLIDELLSVGDAYFQRKCIRRIESFIAEGRTLLLVSHDLHSVRELCHEAIWLDKGRIRDRGSARDVVKAYVDRARARRAPSAAGKGATAAPDQAAEKAPGEPLAYRATSASPRLRQAVIDATRLPDARSLLGEGTEVQAVQVGQEKNPTMTGSGEVEILEVRILDRLGQAIDVIPTFDPLTVAVTFRTIEPVEDPVLGIAIFRNDEVYVFGPNTRFSKVEEMRGTYDGVYTYFLHYPRLFLLAGTYRISIAVYDKAHLRPYIWHNQLYELKVTSDQKEHGLVYMDHHWGLVTHARGDEEDLP